MKNNPYLKGILYSIIGYTLWVLTDALLKRVTESGMPIYEMTALMCPVMAATMLANGIYRGQAPATAWKSLWPKRLVPQAIVSAIGFCAQLTCVLALKHLPLNVFYVSVFTAPMMIALLARFFLAEPLSWQKLTAIIVGFAGVVIAVAWGASGGTQPEAIGYIAALACAASFAINMVVARKLIATESAESLTFYNAVQQAGLSIITLLIMGDGVAFAPSLGLFLAMAGIMNAAGCFFTFESLKHAPAAVVAPYHYSQLLSGAVVAFFIWHEIPTPQLVFGALLIIASGVYMAMHSRTGH